MSTTNTITPISSPLKFESTISSQSQSYNDLINYGSIRKQFSRLIPQYMNYQNKKYSSNLKFSSDFEEYQKLKKEITSMKESILILKEKQQQKLEQIEQLRCLMRKVGAKQYNNNNYKDNTLHAINYNNRETNTNKNNNQHFRGNKDKKQNCNNIKGSFDESDSTLCLMPTTSGVSSGKDDEAALEGGVHPDSGEKDGDYFNNNSSSNNTCFNSSNNDEECRWNLVVEEDKKYFILGGEE